MAGAGWLALWPGVGISRESAAWREATGPNGQEGVGQGGHAAASLMAKHEISRQLSLQAKLTGLYHPACRGAPRNAGVTLRYAF